MSVKNYKKKSDGTLELRYEVYTVSESNNKYQTKLPTTTTAGKVLKSTSASGIVEWGDVGGGVTDVKIGTTSIVSGGIATIPEAGGYQSGIVNTSNQTFSGVKFFKEYITTNKHLIVYGDDDDGDDYKPSNLTGFTDLDTFYYNTGVTLFDGDTEDVYKISYPGKDGTFALTNDFATETSNNQSTTVLIRDATTNINGWYLSTFREQSTTLSGYTVTLVSDSQTGTGHVSNERAKVYMKAMTGSEFVPMYDYNAPKQVLFVDSAGTIWKPQYMDVGSGVYNIVLFKISSVATNLENGLTLGSLEQRHDGSTFSFVNPNSPLGGTTVNIGTATGTYASMFGGKGRVEGKRGFVNGTQVVASGNYSHAEGNNTHAAGVNSHAEGSQTMSSGNASHSEGTGTLASGNNSHAFGNSTIASGYNSIAGGEYSKAEQDNTFSLGYYSYVGNTDQQYTVPSGGGGGSGGGTVKQSTTKSYAIGDHTQALGSYAFVGGYYSKITANGQGSFVYGSQCTANALDSAAIGEGLTTNNTSQFVCGRFNSVRNNTLFEVGNGTADNNRSNALEVFADGTLGIPNFNSNGVRIGTKRIKCINGVLTVID